MVKCQYLVILLLLMFIIFMFSFAFDWRLAFLNCHFLLHSQPSESLKGFVKNVHQEGSWLRNYWLFKVSSLYFCVLINKAECSCRVGLVVFRLVLPTNISALSSHQDYYIIYHHTYNLCARLCDAYILHSSHYFVTLNDNLISVPGYFIKYCV